jgi:ATP-dependent helicase/nuclease subunit A
VRLLYVGVTRARDYVVFAPAADTVDPPWLRLLDTPDHAQHVALPSAGESAIHIGDLAIPARVISLSGSAAVPARVQTRTFVSLESAPVLRAPLHRRPGEERGEADYAVVARIELGPRLHLTGSPDMTVLGTALHAVLAADVSGWTLDKRVARAEAILGRWGVHELAPRAAIEAADRLNKQLIVMWPSARVRREVPIYARLGIQLVRGRIDVLITAADCSVRRPLL